MKALWIRVEAHEVDSKLVDQLASTLAIPDAHALGLYVALGGSVAEHAPDGLIADVSDTKLEAWAHWSGKRGAFAKAARAILQNDAGELVDWAESMGQLVERRKRDLARKVGGNSTEIPRNPRGNSTATERNGTERKRNGTERNGTYSASSSTSQSSNKRSGTGESDDSADDAASASAPPAVAGTEKLPPRALEFLATFYADATEKRTRDVTAQLLATLGTGARLDKNTRVRAGTPERLTAKIGEVIAEGVREPDRAIRVLLLKLADTSDGSAPGVRQAAAAAEAEQQDERATRADLARAEAWLADHPDHAVAIDQQLDDDGFGTEDGDEGPAAIGRAIARRARVLEAWREAGSPEVQHV